jgi:hypothetical protein
MFSRHLLREKVNKVHWFYGIVKPNVKNVIFHKGLEDKWSDIIAHRDIVVIDDLFVEGAKNDELTNAFTRLAHHRGCTLIYITQNLFQQSRDSRTRALNTHYLILTKNPRDQLTISILSRQMYPDNSHFLTHAYRDATKEPFSYLLIDLRQETPNHIRVRTGIFPGDDYYVYINGVQ